MPLNKTKTISFPLAREMHLLPYNEISQGEEQQFSSCFMRKRGKKKLCNKKPCTVRKERFLYSLWAEERNVINIAFVEWEETYSTPNFKTPAHPNEKSVLNLKQEKWFQIFHYSKTTKTYFRQFLRNNVFFLSQEILKKTLNFRRSYIILKLWKQFCTITNWKLKEKM